MSISTKYKRKLMHEGKAYYWYIAPNYEHPRIWKNFDVLHIVAEDRSLFLSTFLEFMNPMPKSVTPALVKEMIIKGLKAKGKAHEI